MESKTIPVTQYVFGQTLNSIKQACDDSQKAFRGYRSGHPLDKAMALLETLKRIDGSIHSWGRHYFFCRDEEFLVNLDNEIHENIRGYLGFYLNERK
jgi:RNA-directed DNA polymerase